MSNFKNFNFYIWINVKLSVSKFFAIITIRIYRIKIKLTDNFNKCQWPTQNITRGKVLITPLSARQNHFNIMYSFTRMTKQVNGYSIIRSPKRRKWNKKEWTQNKVFNELSTEINTFNESEQSVCYITATIQLINYKYNQIIEIPGWQPTDPKPKPLSVYSYLLD